MSTKTSSSHFVLSITCLLVAVLLATPSAATQLSPTNGACAFAVPLEPGDTWRDPGPGSNAACFTASIDRVDLGAANALVVELSQPATDARAHLVLVDTPPRARVVLQTATTLVLAARPGHVRFQVATDDPRAALASFRLDVSLARIAMRDEDDTELELEPDPLEAHLPMTKDEDDTELELEPDPLVAHPPMTKDEDDTELELEPDPLMTPVDTTPSDLSILTRVRFLVALAPDAMDRDDHGDTLLHATPLTLGQIIAGDLSNAWGDDTDVFRFEVTRIGPVAIQVESDTALDVELFDRHGLRIDVPARFKAGTRAAPTLVPGRYFVRIASSGGNATRYALTVDRVSER